ncbi:putative WD repeat-containing protein C26H5.03 [Hypsizygus marmoreus]|uniref:WD repeat-containing protein C26H5.03 n=1 Tax=Hypsizygus marmoreus TaxID=39966 RepID=A0A369JBS0_HYPMA|nr:putative WD repeat-containing protein C26H5.03 [Hypsizygus marmoreus]
MRFRTLEIRWHDSKPISTCDFQPVSFKKARPPAGQEKNFASHSYRLATGGEDNHVRLWMVYPNIRPSTLVESEDASAGPRPPRVEYLATLSRHSAAVNVVRFSPNGELIASAGDDGMIIIWSPSSSPQATTYGSDLTPEELQLEKEYWKPRTTFRCTAMQVYDLAWSPNGDYIIAGSTDNTARVFATGDGKCVQEIAEHTHYVQGVAWDPLNEYIATQSSDRSMHVYRISTKQGIFEAHAIGKNTRMPHRHSRTPSSSRPHMFRSQSITSDAESAIDDAQSSSGNNHTRDTAPLTPAMSTASTSSMFPPPSVDKPSSRRSSFSGSNAPGSPSTYSRYGRSPSPMPPLPAIRSQASPSLAAWASVKLYGDESFTNFFRRLTFSPDGGLLMTPAGQFEDPAVIPGSSKSANGRDDGNGTPARGRKGRPSVVTDLSSAPTTATINPPPSSTSSVYIYSRANFARPPVAQLPGHKKASVAVRFSPILYELRPGVEGGELHETKSTSGPGVLEKGVEGSMDVDVLGPVATGSSSGLGSLVAPQPHRSHSRNHSQSFSGSIAAPSPLPALSMSGLPESAMASPMLSPMDLRPPTPAASKPPTPVPVGMQTPSRSHHNHSQSQSQHQTGSVFALPYRMMFAVVTMDTVAIYDTQQAGPVCLLTKLHYDEFTDMTWSPDGQCLIVSSRDGYCTLITFDEILPAHHTQQHTLQLQSIAHHHSVPVAYSSSSSATHQIPSSSPAAMTTPNSKKRSDPPLTPAASVDGGEVSDIAGGSMSEKEAGEERDRIQEPPKKKRRVALTRVGDLDL